MKVESVEEKGRKWPVEVMSADEAREFLLREMLNRIPTFTRRAYTGDVQFTTKDVREFAERIFGPRAES